MLASAYTRHPKFPVSSVARVKLSFKLQHGFPAAFLESCQLVILLLVDWWKYLRVPKMILQQEKMDDTYLHMCGSQMNLSTAFPIHFHLTK